MLTQNEIINNIVTILKKEEQVDRVYFLASYLVGGMPYEVSLIIYENCRPNYMVSQSNYEQLLRGTTGDIILNILPVNCNDAQKSLDRRLEDTLCIYERKETE